MRIITPIILILIVNHSVAQKNGDFISDFLLEEELQDENIVNELSKYDFSNLWTFTKNQFVYGIIGSDHQRLRIKLISIDRNPFDSLEYIVFGKSMVKETICEFVGVIRLIENRELEKFHYGVDNEYKKDGILGQGLLVAEYEFRENRAQNYSGLIKGKLYSKWYLDSNKNIKYDDIQSIADGYSNNAFIGTWESYKSNKIKICNWGDYRIPQVNKDFDIGAGEFSVSEKYWEKGWLDIALKNQIPNEVIIRDKSDEEVKEWWNN